MQQSQDPFHPNGMEVWLLAVEIGLVWIDSILDCSKNSRVRPTVLRKDKIKLALQNDSGTNLIHSNLWTRNRPNKTIIELFETNPFSRGKQKLFSVVPAGGFQERSMENLIDRGMQKTKFCFNVFSSKRHKKCILYKCCTNETSFVCFNCF